MLPALILFVALPNKPKPLPMLSFGEFASKARIASLKDFKDYRIIETTMVRDGLLSCKSKLYFKNPEGAIIYWSTEDNGPSTFRETIINTYVLNDATKEFQSLTSIAASTLQGSHLEKTENKVKIVDNEGVRYELSLVLTFETGYKVTLEVEGPSMK